MVALIALKPQAKARELLFHFGESSGGSRMEGITGMKGVQVNRHCGPMALRNAQADIAQRSKQRAYPRTKMFFSTKHAPPALRMRLQRSSASARVSAPNRT